MLAFAGWCLFTVYLLAQALAGPAIIWNDSLTYIHIASRALWSKAFWAGPRPPATPLLIDLVGSSSGFLAAQALHRRRLVGIPGLDSGPPGRSRMAASSGRLGDPCLRHRLPGHPLEPLGSLRVALLSLLALLFATSIWAARRLTWPRVAAVSGVCLCFAATRDAQVWTVGFLALAVGMGALLAVRKGPGPGHPEPERWPSALPQSWPLTGWGTVSSHRTKQNVADVFFVRIFPFPDRVAWFAAHGMPEQQQIDLLAKATTATPGTAKAVFFSATDPDVCSAGALDQFPGGPTRTASGFSPIRVTCSPSRCSARNGPSISPTGASRSMRRRPTPRSRR